MNNAQKVESKIELIEDAWEAIRQEIPVSFPSQTAAAAVCRKDYQLVNILLLKAINVEQLNTAMVENLNRGLIDYLSMELDEQLLIIIMEHETEHCILPHLFHRLAVNDGASNMIKIILNYPSQLFDTRRLNSGLEISVHNEDDRNFHTIASYVDKIYPKTIGHLFYSCQLDRAKALIDQYQIDLIPEFMKMAIFSGNLPTLEYLMDKGLDINFVHRTGCTALESAAIYPRPNMVELLLAHQAVIRPKTLLDVVRITNGSQSFVYLEIIDLLLCHGADPRSEVDDHPLQICRNPTVLDLLENFQGRRTKRA